jgi:predicted acyl esterase
MWLPDSADARCRVPAILEYLPYRKDDATAADDARRHPYFAEHGFGAVRVDLRGTGDSEGVCLGEYLPQEQADALEVLSWLATQEWCTGAVGMIGYSWGGFNGLQVAALRPPQLKAVVTLYSTDDRYSDDCHYAGGCLLGGDMLKWASWMLAFNSRPPDPLIFGEGWRDAWLARLEATPPYLADWVTHQRRDEFWRQGSIAEDYSAIEVPVLAVGGWADAYTNAVPRLLENLSCPRRAIIGPWGHIFPERGIPGPKIGFLQECVRWFGQWLLGEETGVMDEPMLRAWIQESLPPADFYAERPGRWVAESGWPPPSVEGVSFSLSTAGSDGGGRLAPADSTTATEPVADTSLDLDADQTCGLAAGVWCPNGLPAELAIDQGYDDSRSLLFDTTELEEPLELLGRPVAQLAIMCDRPQANLAVRLCAVSPDGTSTLLSWGALNLTHRDGHEQPVPLVPGQRYDVEVRLNAVGENVPAGHRLRLAVSSAYWPQLWPSPAPVRLTLLTDGSSTLELPVRGSESDAAQPPPQFLSAEESCTPVGTIVETGSRMRNREVDSQTGAAKLHDEQSYRVQISATETDYAHEGTDRWTILPGDPLSAQAECHRTVTIDREDWHIRIETQSSLTCDADQFLLDNEVVAFEGDREVFRRTLRTGVPRDGV